jgi:hypothetical protein
VCCDCIYDSIDLDCVNLFLLLAWGSHRSAILESSPRIQEEIRVSFSGRGRRRKTAMATDLQTKPWCVGRAGDEAKPSGRRIRMVGTDGYGAPEKKDARIRVSQKEQRRRGLWSHAEEGDEDEEDDR